MEIETKILNVNSLDVIKRITELGAKEVLKTRFVVDWFEPKGTIENQEPWFLRIRTTSDGKSEATWKANRKFLGAASQHKEINLTTEDPETLGELFQALGLEKYAHQEKDRISFILDDWRFDLDQYPEIPAYLEIEGKGEEHIQEAIKLLNLENNKATPLGERVVIQSEYGKNWHSMYF